MKFNRNYLATYEKLLKTTDLQKGYQEFIKLFRYLRVGLEKDLSFYSLYSFYGNIVENEMDYSYFQFTNEELKAKGLKIIIAFIHSTFTFEIWLSGYNRKYQRDYYERLKNRELKYDLNQNPSKVDYIIRYPMNEISDLSDGDTLLHTMETNIIYFLEDLKTIL